MQRALSHQCGEIELTIKPRTMNKWEEILSKRLLPVWIIGTENLSCIEADTAIVSLGIGYKFHKNLLFPKKYEYVHVGKSKGIRVASANIPAGTLILESLLKVLSLAGIKNIIGIGAAGGLQDNIRIGDIILPQSAFTGEGLSHYYNHEKKLIEADNKTRELLSRQLTHSNYSNHQGKIYTTASIVKETDEFIEKLKIEGFLAIECEMAALYFLSREFGLKAAGLLVITDHPFKKQLSSDHPDYQSAVKRAINQIDKLITNFIQSTDACV
ncbi:hypothetical protein KKB18_07930 [bacterium]|nr:hypothetical protein [bacterium]